MDSKEPALKHNPWLLLFVGMYLVSYFLPAFSLWKGEVLYGFECALAPYRGMINSIIYHDSIDFLQAFVMSLPNLAIVLVLFFNKKLSKTFGIVLFWIVLLSTGFWILGYQNLMIGYYLWFFACNGIIINTLLSKYEFKGIND